MGQKSTKENKNIYFKSREAAGLTRAEASEAMVYISESRIEKMETGKTTIRPEDVIAMAKAYKNASLCNFYCTHDCRIGQEYIPEIKEANLSEISLGILSSLNSLERQKERLIEITEDGKISDDELEDFIQIKKRLEKISHIVDSLQLWINNSFLNNGFNKELMEDIENKQKAEDD